MKLFNTFLFAAALAALSTPSFAQQKKENLIYPKNGTEEKKAKPVKSPETPKVKAGFGVTVVQGAAQFPGGEDSLVSFLGKNITYPKKSRQSGVEGRVFIGFQITKAGKIDDVRVLSSVNDELDEEALRVVKMMPDWAPGKNGDSAVAVQYILPFDFILPKTKQVRSW